MNRYWFPGMLITVGWICFIVSFFLPATNVLERSGSGPLVGWDAALTSITIVSYQPLILLAEPKVLLFLLFPLINLLMLVSPVVAIGAPKLAISQAFIFIPAGLFSLIMPHVLLGDLFVGFYLWAGSFLVVSAGCILLTLIAIAKSR